MTITGVGFEWDSPPSTLCQTFGISSPGVPFSVTTRSTFTVSWYVTCQYNASVPQGTTHSINSASPVFGSPFSIVTSNVPVTVQYGHYSGFNVTFAAPSSSWSGQLFVLITASEN